MKCALCRRSQADFKRRLGKVTQVVCAECVFRKNTGPVELLPKPQTGKETGGRAIGPIR
jgi:hypothetical protein